MSNEVRVTNETTGGQKGRKLARFDLLPPDALRQVAEHYGKGVEKYEDRNWEKGYDWSLSFGAAQRHLWQFWNGEDIDPETQSHHLCAVIFHCMSMLTFDKTHPELDDRPATTARRAELERMRESVTKHWHGLDVQTNPFMRPGQALIVNPDFMHTINDWMTSD